VKEDGEDLPWMTIPMLATHNPVDIATTILFLSQMAMLESLMRILTRRDGPGCKGLLKHTFEEKSRAKRKNSRDIQRSRKTN